MTESKLTLDDIAHMAGVSRATASRVLSGQVGARSKSRAAVMRVIEETGYQPNVAARALASKKTSILGLVVPTPVSFIVADSFSLRFIEAILQSCNEHSHTLALFMLAIGEDEQTFYRRIVQQGLLDGVIFTSGHGHYVGEMVNLLQASHLPFVVSGSYLQHPKVSYVDYDHEKGAYSAVSHLVRLGRKRIATVTGLLDTPHGVSRLEGYRRALHDRGVRIDQRLIVSADFTEEGGYRAAEQLLPNQPDGIFVASDRMAKGVVRYLKERSVRVPEDIAIVGFDDLEPALQTDPPLSTVRTSVNALANTLVDILIDIIDNGSHPAHHVVLDTELVIRGSCGARHTG